MAKETTESNFPATPATAPAGPAKPSTTPSPAKPSYAASGTSSGSSGYPAADQPELHFPEEERSYVLHRLPPCPICHREAVLSRRIVKIKRVWRFCYVVSCKSLTCPNTFPLLKSPDMDVWSDSGPKAVLAWNTYCRLTQDDRD